MNYLINKIKFVYLDLKTKFYFKAFMAASGERQREIMEKHWYPAIARRNALRGQL